MEKLYLTCYVVRPLDTYNGLILEVAIDGLVIVVGNRNGNQRSSNNSEQELDLGSFASKYS